MNTPVEPIAPLQPKKGDYVLATKYSDGDPGDPWAVGFYGGMTGEIVVVRGNDGRPVGLHYRHVGRITPEIGNWLMANAKLLEDAPSKINLWRMYDWGYINERIRESEEDSAEGVVQ